MLLAKRQRSLGDVPALAVWTGDQLPPGGAFWHGWWQDAVAGGSALSKNLVVPGLAGFWTAPWEGEKSLL